MGFNIFRAKRGADAILGVVEFALKIKKRLEKANLEAIEDMAKNREEIEKLKSKNAEISTAISLGQAFVDQINTMMTQAQTQVQNQPEQVDIGNKAD